MHRYSETRVLVDNVGTVFLPIDFVIFKLLDVAREPQFSLAPVFENKVLLFCKQELLVAVRQVRSLI